MKVPAEAVRSVIERIGMLLRVFHQFAKAFRRHRAMHDDDVVDESEKSDRLEISMWLVGQTLVQVGVEQHARIRKQADRISIGLCRLAGVGADYRARSRTVLDDDRIGISLPDGVGEGTYHHVPAASRCVGHQNSGRAGDKTFGSRSVLRSEQGERSKREDARRAAKNCTGVSHALTPLSGLMRVPMELAQHCHHMRHPRA